VLGAIRGVDLVVEVGVEEHHILLDAASPDSNFVAQFGTSEPRGAAPIGRADVKVLGDADDSDCRRFSKCAARAGGTICSSSAVATLSSSVRLHTVIGGVPFAISFGS
jgi:hypothetical protein